MTSEVVELTEVVDEELDVLLEDEVVEEVLVDELVVVLDAEVVMGEVVDAVTRR